MVALDEIIEPLLHPTVLVSKDEELEQAYKKQMTEKQIKKLKKVLPKFMEREKMIMDALSDSKTILPPKEKKQARRDPTDAEMEAYRDDESMATSEDD